MGTRIVTGVIAAILFAAVLVQPFTIVFAVVMAALAVVSVYELCVKTGMAPQKELWIASALYAAFVPFRTSFTLRDFFLISSVYVLYLCVVAVVCHEKVSMKTVAYVGFMTLLSSMLFGSLATLRHMRLAAVGLVLLVPWANDTGAYFIGTWFGKHKLCPKLSPKKSVEGLIGGIVFSVGIELLAAWIYGAFLRPQNQVDYRIVALLALIGAPLAVFGDLLASRIKRECAVKDYGNLLPGHGGVMDRFDSFLLYAFPAYVLWMMFPFIRG